VPPGPHRPKQLHEGWVLLDGRDVGLPRQLVAFNGEADAPREAPPTAEAQRIAEDRAAARRRATAEAVEANGSDSSVRALVAGAGLPDEVSAKLEAAGIIDLEALLTRLSSGDLHTELKACGIGKLGQRQKLAAIVAPYWSALALKEQGNSLYRSSRFEEAAQKYSAAIEAMPCQHIDLALTCYSNRAACLQQMREPEGALADTLHVLRFDPANSKALARRKVYLEAVQDA